MALNLDIVGKRLGPVEHAWEERDCLLYALGIGAGSVPPIGSELAFTTENSSGVEMQVFPTFATVIGLVPTPPPSSLGSFEPSSVVQGEQAFTLPRPLPVRALARSTVVVSAFYDKGSAAIAVIDSESRDAGGGELLCTTRSKLFIRGEGGFGGEAYTTTRPHPAGRPPDCVVTYETRPEQALLYRLSGDRNPLHSDPEVAKRVGFERPILHGRCTFGIAGRAILHALCGSDSGHLRAMSARFVGPVWPGDTVSTLMWVASEGVVFRVENQRAETVLDQGSATIV